MGRNPNGKGFKENSRNISESYVRNKSREIFLYLGPAWLLRLKLQSKTISKLKRVKIFPKSKIKKF